MKTRGSKIMLSNPGFVLSYLRVFETPLKGRDVRNRLHKPTTMVRKQVRIPSWTH